jgi:DUF1009 family protein
LRKRIGMLAGYGDLPVAFAIEAQAAGIDVCAIGITADVNPQLKQYVAAYREISLGQWQQVIDTLRAYGVQDLVLLGKVEKSWALHTTEVDARFRQVVGALQARNDDRMILAFVTDLAKEGFALRTQGELLSELFPGPGVLSTRRPTQQEWNDIVFGYQMAKGIAGLDIGQTCAVKHGMVLAVEAIEGTDECIRRGGRLGRADVVIVKVAKPQQDHRFDIPTVGPDTLRVMHESGARVLAFEAGATFVLQLNTMCRYADERGMVIVAYLPDRPITS